MKSGYVFYKDAKIPGVWLTDKMFLPDALAREFSDKARIWNPCVEWIGRKVASPMMVSSVVSDFLGKKRASTTSHAKGISLDIGPLFSKTHVLHPEMRSPRMADNRSLAVLLAQSPKPPIGCALEGDHLHFDLRLPSGIYLYSTFREGYPLDASNSALLKTPIHKKMFIAHADGSILPFSF